MNAGQKRRLERLEKLVAAPSAPPTRTFCLVDMISWPEADQRRYEAASLAGDTDTCDRLLEIHEGIPRPVPSTRQRRWSGRRTPLVSVLIVSQILDAPEPIEDEPDRRERTLRDGSAVVVTTPQTAAMADPDEIVGYGPNGYPESRAQRVERLRAQGRGSYQAFDQFGRPL